MRNIFLFLFTEISAKKRVYTPGSTTILFAFNNFASNLYVLIKPWSRLSSIRAEKVIK